VVRVKTDATNNMRRATTPLELNEAGADVLPGHLGIEVTHWAAGEVRGRLPLQRALFAPQGFVHGGTLVAFADSLGGYGCVTCLPEGAQGFTTVELKANLVGAARTGDLLGTAMRVHGGRSTQVWDAKVTDETGRSVALFRCTQLLLWPKPPGAAATRPPLGATPCACGRRSPAQAARRRLSRLIQSGVTEPGGASAIADAYPSAVVHGPHTLLTAWLPAERCRAGATTTGCIVCVRYPKWGASAPKRVADGHDPRVVPIVPGGETTATGAPGRRSSTAKAS
jgi:uncharacterized protein (TIGR00369 family)